MRTGGAEGRGVSGPLSACGEEARFSEMTKKINMYVSFVRGILPTTRPVTALCKAPGSSYVSLASAP